MDMAGVPHNDTSSPDSHGPPAEVLDAWGLGGARLERVAGGHINLTFKVWAGAGTGPGPSSAGGGGGPPSGAVALQRLAPVFGPRVNLDLRAVTARLARAGLTTPLLVPTRRGEAWHLDEEGRTWRCITWVEGESLTAMDTPARCREAGRVLGRFHAATWGWRWSFRHRRLGIHDTARHLADLERALREHRDHPLAGEVFPVAERILERAGRAARLEGLRPRVVHGDPKVSNFVFSPAGEGICLVDLDTVGRMPLAVEMGDALRSWCNPAGEEPGGKLDLEMFEAALTGWLEGLGRVRPDRDEILPIPGAVETIALELAARFCADALQERYFGWDRLRFPTAGHHNLHRARSQLHLAVSARESMGRASALLESVLGS